MNQVAKGSLYTVVFFVVSEIVYKVYCRWKRENETKAGRIVKESESRLSSTSLQVLFFPDKDVPCRDYFITGNGCYKDNCRYSHGKTSLSELYKYMTTCKITMDVCVYVFTCKDLADILVRLFKRGVKIRIITDIEQQNFPGSQVWHLRREGIPVRTDNSSYFMHHKFMIVDGKILINGSFNWTRQAVTGNKENLIITDDSAVTTLFVAEFQRLWKEFEPSGQAALG